jgi:uncharacterized protein YggT (Ycf19 family)
VFRELSVSLSDVAIAADWVARAVALGAAAVSGVVAITHWAVRRRAIAPFGAWSRGVRRVSDPALRPMERQLVRTGGNPQDATYWFFGLTVILGLVLIALVRWLFAVVFSLQGLAHAGPATWLQVAVDWGFGLMMAALVVRVAAGWFGISPFARWLRPFVQSTEWLLKPMRRIAPATGRIDLSPLLAYAALWLGRTLVGTLLARIIR